MATSVRASLIVLAYNQAPMVREAVASCLAQESEPIEIILSDDASSDGTYAILQEMASSYRGPHRVWARRNERNLGIGEHYNQLVAAAAGELLVTAAGDDLSRPQRVARLLAAWDANGHRADLIASHLTDLDDEGRTHETIRVDDLGRYRGVEDWARKRPYIVGASHAFTKRMMQRFGPLDAGVFYEDQVMVFRAIVSGGAITVDEPLVDYRRGGTSRRPDFETVADMKRWIRRQLGRTLSEMNQILADSRVAGCEPQVREHLWVPMTKATYELALNDAATPSERRAAWHLAAGLPVAWRIRKYVHATLPELSFGVRRRLGSWRDQWRAFRVRLGLRRK